MTGNATHILVEIIKKLNFPNPRAMQVYVIVAEVRVKRFDRIVERAKWEGCV
ncbi:MAG: hypothetical protein R3D28_20410 [Geminicoccaceae bacterium]